MDRAGQPARPGQPGLPLHKPRLNETVQDFARHYGVSILPARPYSPKDKASAEPAVQVVERWLMVLHRGERVACHARSARRGGFTTLDEHMPAAHRAHKE